MATARITSGFGVAPGFGKVTNKKPTAWGGGRGNSIQSSLANHPVFTPQTPSHTAPAAGGGGPAVTGPAALPVDPLYDKTIAGLGRTS
jgi:hypothetical protein